MCESFGLVLYARASLTEPLCSYGKRESGHASLYLSRSQVTGVSGAYEGQKEVVRLESTECINRSHTVLMLTIDASLQILYHVTSQSRLGLHTSSLLPGRQYPS